ncbi:unnamed protein product [Penicillium pancosmium]
MSTILFIPLSIIFCPLLSTHSLLSIYFFYSLPLLTSSIHFLCSLPLLTSSTHFLYSLPLLTSSAHFLYPFPSSLSHSPLPLLLSSPLSFLLFTAQLAVSSLLSSLLFIAHFAAQISPRVITMSSPPGKPSSSGPSHSRKVSSSTLSPKEILNQRLGRYEEDTSKKTKDMTKGFLLDFFKILDPKAQAHLAQDAAGCATDKLLRLLVKSITDCLLTPMKGAGGRTPFSAETPLVPRQGIEASIETLIAEGRDPITRADQKALRRRCLQRDGSRCVATRFWDPQYESHPKGAKKADLEAAHIIPFDLGSFKSENSNEVKHNANIWVNLNRYFPTLKAMRFTSEHLNAEKNAMMLERGLHHEFGLFRLCFVATGVENQYRMKTFEDTRDPALMILPAHRTVTFKSHGGGWKLPDPELLRIHAALAEFFHMSGHGERIDKILREFEELGGLASDGSTNVEDLLASRLSSLPFNIRERSGSESESKASGKHVAPKRGGQQPGPSGPENVP